jgi:hypothetical protein
VDVFLTPSFADFDPVTMHCGIGGYAGMHEVRDNILRTARDMNLSHYGRHQLGSTYIGPAHQVLEVAKVQMCVAEHLQTHDFKHSEGTWPGWFAGVITMYAGEIALNHVCRDEIISTDMIDARSDVHRPVKDLLTIHCWHTDKDFSKYRDYRHILTHDLDLEDAVGYCLNCSQLNI